MNSFTLLWGFSFIMITNIAFAQTEEEIQYFANSLFTERDYASAIIELKRVNYMYPENKNHLANKLKISRSYRYIGKQIEAIQELRNVLSLMNDHWGASVQIAKTYQDMFYLYESNDLINAQLHHFQSDQKDTLLYLKALNHFLLKNVDSTKSILNNINQSSSLHKKTTETKELIKEFENSSQNNPSLAAGLNAIFPGLGYMYLGLIQTGISTLFVESLFGYITYQSFKQNNTAGLGFGGTLFSGFYLGSIYGAKQQAIKKNNRLYIYYSKKMAIK
tara:strand:+ start:609 stop:1436 length:828 start_codon:yes stop_codon:yes gene_type:complete